MQNRFLIFLILLLSGFIPIVYAEEISVVDADTVWSLTLDNVTSVGHLVGEPSMMVFKYADAISYQQLEDAQNVGHLVDEPGVIVVKYADAWKIMVLELSTSDIEGDVNLNRHVTITDALFIARYKAGLISLTPDQLKAADTNDDGSVTITDALYIAKWLANPAFPLWDPVKDADMQKPIP